MRFRPLGAAGLQIIKWLLIALSCFHFYTAGFGLLREDHAPRRAPGLCAGPDLPGVAAGKKAYEQPVPLMPAVAGRRAAGGLAAGPGLRGQRAVHPLGV
jgi:hypothetical protein